MALAKLRDGSLIRMLVAGEKAQAYILVCPSLNLARTVDSGGVAVQKKADHHLGGIGRLTATVLRRIRGIDGAQIKRRDHIDQKTGQVPLRKPIVKRRWEHQDLVDRVR